eukprot:snap_masked-scaffold_31-processed-gene-1.28-mRNA-1 protein AED:1.00 eAED:1.00 QI:0/0/0/0/1/1/2/0/219
MNNSAAWSFGGNKEWSNSRISELSPGEKVKAYIRNKQGFLSEEAKALFSQVFQQQKDILNILQHIDRNQREIKSEVLKSTEKLRRMDSVLTHLIRQTRREEEEGLGRGSIRVKKERPCPTLKRYTKIQLNEATPTKRVTSIRECQEIFSIADTISLKAEQEIFSIPDTESIEEEPRTFEWDSREMVLPSQKQILMNAELLKKELRMARKRRSTHCCEES